MIHLSEDTLICDLAETYHIYDYRSLPLKTVATLSAGLREDSRIRLLAADAPADLEVLILSAIADNLTLLRAGMSKDKTKPFLFTDAIWGDKKKIHGAAFDTVEDFEATLTRIRGD